MEQEQQQILSHHRHPGGASYSYFHTTTTATTMNNHHRHPPSPGALFECVAQQDYDGILHILASEGVRVLQSQCTWQQHQGSHHSHGSYRGSSADYHHHHHHRRRHDHDNLMDDSDQETKSDPYRPQAVERNVAAYSALMGELTDFLHNNDNTAAGKSRNNKLDISPEAERLLRESLAVFVDSRPPADFVVYADDVRDVRGGEAAIDEQGDSFHHNNNNNAVQDPPLFDGSVANATPPPLDGGPAGGAGTLLHLATALDQPLVLALCLALGGDARACHTAFRRLLIHEAACNGSLHCLTLLLELGREFSGTLTTPPEEQPRRTATASLPFLPRRLDRAQALAALPFLAQQPVKQTPPTNVMNLLQHFRSLVQQVRQEGITELEAARAVLKQATLKPVSQRSLARACQFHARTTVWRGGSLDGHGNTPLHWAAFKNETQCVSLLLSYGADPNARAHPSGWTPLHDAAYSNSVESIGLLISAGAHVDARANSGATPLCFAAQEDADRAVDLLLQQGANLTTRCAGSEGMQQQQQQQQQQPSRFSGYTPLHYCAHYNARKAAVVLLRHATARRALEIPDLSDRLPIHVAVARGSANVLRELLHAGARVETRWAAQQQAQHRQSQENAAAARRPPSPEQPSTPRRRAGSDSSSGAVTPVSSPVLRSMIPSQPVTSAKPWNCLTQQSIDECRHLISEAESYWSPQRHALFTPADRQAVRTVLLVGQRLEQQGIFPEVWFEVLSFCGRGWFDFEPSGQEQEDGQAMEDDHDEDLVYDSHLSLPTF